MNIFRFVLTIALVVVSHCTFAQNAKVKGIITDDLNNFVEGAVVSLKGTTYTATTDKNGLFQMENVPLGDYTVEVIAENHSPYSQAIKVTGVETDLGFLNTSTSLSMAEESQDNIPTVSLSDTDVKESSTQSVSGVLSASRDAFNSAASFTFSAARFKVRGYDNDNNVTYMNGVPMTDLVSGNSMFYLWGGLNDVTRNRESFTGLAASGFAFGGIGGGTFLDTRASKQRKQLQASFALSNRAYENRAMVTYGTGLLKGGWAFAGSLSRRWSDEGYVPGTYYNGWSYFLAGEKIINTEHSLSLTAFGTPTERGKSSPAMQEMYDLAGSNYYNPSWGYQNGEKRNASVNISHQPTVILSHDWKINNLSTLKSSFGYTFGENINTGLDWYNAPDPRPDFYRKLPSYIDDPAVSQMVADQLRNNETLRQIQWDQMYQVNLNSFETIQDANGVTGSTYSGKRSKYILEERVADSRKMHISTNYNTSFSENTQFSAGASFMKQKTDNFKRVKDLLGGEFYVDINQYAEQDFADSLNAIQNDANNPNRILKEGDKFGYNYTSDIIQISGWLQNQWKFDNIDVFGAVNISQTSYKRIGNVRNGLFQNNSFGESKTQNFVNYAVKGGATYKLNGRNYLFMNVAQMTRAPFFENAFVSARTRNQYVPGLSEERIFSTEGGYLLRAPKVKARAVIYYTQFNNQTNTVSFYHSDYRNFVNYSITDIDKRHFGSELAVDYTLGKGFSTSMVLALGQYYYSSRPNATISVDNTSELLANNETVYAKNFYVGGTPQDAFTLGFNYRAKRFWFINMNFNYYNNSYLDFNPARRTVEAIDLVDPSTAQWDNIVTQEKLNSEFTIDFFGGKSWKLNNYFKNMKRNNFLLLNVGVSNILNNKDQITGGYEQLRYDYVERNPDSFKPKYFYAFGTTYFVNLILRMN
ncbi:MAG: TonB-dependent receptor [Bacteroidetes bacterium]|nr:TonB-dependent receptor [Bacteroidota bacterium]MBK8873492.1 TonB-dependent receptor [Bacteroidota bacterium]MBK9424473.1 TonB-dependent receptor [Bacteroidota bacterium]